MFGCRYCGKQTEFDENQQLAITHSGRTAFFDHKYTCNERDCLQMHLAQFGKEDRVIVMRYIMSLLEVQMFPYV